MSLVQRLAAAWRALVSPSALPAPMPEDPTLMLQRDLAAIRLDLQETQAALVAERARTAALDKAQATLVQEGITAHLEALFIDLAAPLSQLRLQAALLDAGTAVAAADVMALARRCIAVVERAGLEPIGTTGEVMPFDPETAQALGEGVQIAPGDTIRIRIAGYRYHHRVLRKAFVEQER